MDKEFLPNGTTSSEAIEVLRLAFFRMVSVSTLMLFFACPPAGPTYSAASPPTSKSETMSSMLSSEMSSRGGRGGAFFARGSSFFLIEKPMKSPAMDYLRMASSSSSSGWSSVSDSSSSISYFCVGCLSAALLSCSFNVRRCMN